MSTTPKRSRIESLKPGDGVMVDGRPSVVTGGHQVELASGAVVVTAYTSPLDNRGAGVHLTYPAGKWIRRHYEPTGASL